MELAENIIAKRSAFSSQEEIIELSTVSGGNELSLTLLFT